MSEPSVIVAQLPDCPHWCKYHLGEDLHHFADIGDVNLALGEWITRDEGTTLVHRSVETVVTVEGPECLSLERARQLVTDLTKVLDMI